MWIGLYDKDDQPILTDDKTLFEGFSYLYIAGAGEWLVSHKGMSF